MRIFQTEQAQEVKPSTLGNQMTTTALAYEADNARPMTRSAVGADDS